VHDRWAATFQTGAKQGKAPARTLQVLPRLDLGFET